MTEAISWRSFVALGDSVTEGLEDRGPHGEPIGWADRFAQHLADRSGRTLNYANLAIRGRLLAPILAEQVEPALALKPDLVSLWGGGNDMLRPRADPDAMASAMEEAVIRFREAGADVLIGLGVDTKDSPILNLTRSRSAIYNLALTGIARRHGAFLIDLWNVPVLQDFRLWNEDRLHPNSDGHERIAQAALAGLGLTPDDPQWYRALPPGPRMNHREQLDWNLVWARDHLAPWVGRRLRGTSSGAGRSAKQPTYRIIQPRR